MREGLVSNEHFTQNNHQTQFSDFNCRGFTYTALERCISEMLWHSLAVRGDDIACCPRTELLRTIYLAFQHVTVKNKCTCNSHFKSSEPPFFSALRFFDIFEYFSNQCRMSNQTARMCHSSYLFGSHPLYCFNSKYLFLVFKFIGFSVPHMETPASSTFGNQC